MAGWITHLRIADEILKQLPELDSLGFCMGSIAPDCNVENEDWTAFAPSREVTHWMTGEKKLTADDEGFYRRYLAGQNALSNQESSFYWGYVAHLMTDASFYRFIHDEERWKRVYAIPEVKERLAGMPFCYENLKRAFGKTRVFAGWLAMENEYLYAHPECSYRTLLQSVQDFPSYVDYLPEGAILRKIHVMGGMPEPCAGPIDQTFFTYEEMERYIADTCQEIVKRIRRATTGRPYKGTGAFLPRTCHPEE